MSADNRRNPDRTDIDGHFGWDVYPGYYRVRASRAGCTGEALTKALPVPPPVTDLLLKLRCAGLKRAATHTTARVKGRSLVVRTRAAGRDPVGLVNVRAGKQRAFGFLVRGRVTIALPAKPRGKIEVRYAGNARWAPSAAAKH